MFDLATAFPATFPLHLALSRSASPRRLVCILGRLIILPDFAFCFSLSTQTPLSSTDRLTADDTHMKIRPRMPGDRWSYIHNFSIYPLPSLFLLSPPLSVLHAAFPSCTLSHPFLRFVIYIIILRRLPTHNIKLLSCGSSSSILKTARGWMRREEEGCVLSLYKIMTWMKTRQSLDLSSE